MLKCWKLEISFAPQLRLSPSKAMCLPLMVWCGEPLAIVQPVWPGMGQLHVSPGLMTFFMRVLSFECGDTYLTAVAASLPTDGTIDLILRKTSTPDSSCALRFSSEGGLMKIKVASCGSRRLTARLGPPAR